MADMFNGVSYSDPSIFLLYALIKIAPRFLYGGTYASQLSFTSLLGSFENNLVRVAQIPGQERVLPVNRF